MTALVLIALPRPGMIIITGTAMPRHGRNYAGSIIRSRLDDLAATELGKVGGIGMSRFYPTYRHGEGFPGHTCLSVNEEVVHGIPGPRKLREGDIITLDLALKVDGYCCDMAITVPGKPGPIEIPAPQRPAGTAWAIQSARLS